MLYGIIVDYMKVDPDFNLNHECPVDCSNTQATSIFTAGLEYTLEELQKLDIIWFTDGSSYYVKRTQYTGYTETQIDANQDHKITWVINGKCNFTSAQAAELMAIIVTIKNTPATATMRIFSHSEWVVQALSDWLLVWQSKLLHLRWQGSKICQPCIL